MHRERERETQCNKKVEMVKVGECMTFREVKGREGEIRVV